MSGKPSIFPAPGMRLAAALSGSQIRPTGGMMLNWRAKPTKGLSYCAGGGRSVLAALTLKQLGYKNVVAMKGGFRAWETEGHRPTIPTERRVCADPSAD